MNYKDLEKELLLTDEDICELVNRHSEKIGTDEVIEMLKQIAAKQEEQEADAFESAPLLLKIAFAARETYRYGYMYGLYAFNNAVKERLSAMQEEQVDLTSKEAV